MTSVPRTIVRGVVLLIFPSLVALSNGCHVKRESPPERTSSGKVETGSGSRVDNGEEAIRRVIEVVGVPAHLAQRASAELVTLTDDNTPFLSEQIVGRPLWQVVINNWKVELPSAASGFEDSFDRTFDVLVDAANGQILKIASRWPEGVPEISPEPPAWSAEDQMQRTGFEKYHGFPQDDPSLTFLEALDVVFREGVGSPFSAKQITAHYVVRSHMRREPKPVWAITLRGIPPLVAAFPGVPEDARNHLRNIVDASTGEWISADTSPQPISSAASPLLPPHSTQPTSRPRPGSPR